MKNITAYFKPQTIAAAVNLLRTQPGRGKFIAGGTNLLVEQNPALDYLIDLRALGLNYITETDAAIHIGACATIQQLAQAALLRTLADGLLPQVAAWFASRQIRNVATIGGNIAEGLSAADTAPALLAMDAQVVLVGDRERIVPLAEFFCETGGTILADELIKEFLIPKTLQQARGKFSKNCKTREDIAIVSVAVTVRRHEQRCANVRIALGAVAPTPIRMLLAERVLEGHFPTEALIQEAAETVVANIHPIDNFRASADFRKEISRVYVRRALAECLDRSS